MMRPSVISRSATAVFMLGAVTGFLRAQDFNFPELGRYGQLSEYCGQAPISVNAPVLPQIGCFVLSSGHYVQGAIVGHQVNVSVDANGQEVFAVDGTIVTEMFDQTRAPHRFTNLPFVHLGGIAGFTFCQRATDDWCPTRIDVFNRRPDKSILFMVVQCVPPNYRTCVTTKENWNFELSRAKQGGR
jgi:hypothetical protein